MKNKIIFKTLMLKGEAGSTIVSMEKTGHVGTADIYTITFNDGSTTEISLENMSAITSVEKTSSTDTEDIYTITCADGSTQTFSVLNHNADIAAMSEDIDTIDARVDNFINSVVPNTVETLWTGSIKDVGDSATLSKAVSNFDYIDLYLLGSSDSKYIRVPATQTAVDIQQQNLSDDASSNFLRLWEMGVSISGSTVSITKSIAWAWDDPNNSNPTVTANAQNGVPITRIDGVNVASDTPAEVTDIRVGANGTTYNSAGAAVRGQISDLKNTYLNDLRTTNRIAYIGSETVSGTGSYLLKEIKIPATSEHYYATIESETGGVSGNFAAYLAAYDSSDNRLEQVVFPTSYPSKIDIEAPAGTVQIRVRLFATLATSATASVTFSGISVNTETYDVNVKLNDGVEIDRLATLEEMMFGSETTETKTFTEAGESNLDITINIETGKKYYITIENQDVEGGVQIYGWNGAYTSLGYVFLNDVNNFAFESLENYTKIRFHYVIDSVSTTPKSDVSIVLKPVYDENNYNVIHVGNGFDYEDIQAAIDSCPDSATTPYIIFIHNGEYSEFSTYDNDQRVRYISFIGESRCGVIVRGNKGTYAKPTAEISSNGAVRNITFIQETSAETQETGGAYPYCYALHDDYFGADTEYENCTFISNAGPAVGMGLKENKSKAFRNCTFINNGDGTFGSISLGAFFGHNEASDNKQNQELIIENCTAINENGINGLYLALVSTVTGATYKGVNVRNCGSFGNGQAAANCTLPLSYSYGNNVDSLNVI